MAAPSSAAHPTAQDDPRLLRRTYGPQKTIHAFAIGNPPAHVGINRESPVDGFAAGVLGEQFRPRQVEELKTVIQALDRLDGGRPLQVQAGLVLPGPVEGCHGPAELGQIDELGPIDREQGRADRPAHDDQEDQQQQELSHEAILQMANRQFLFGAVNCGRTGRNCSGSRSNRCRRPGT